MAKKVLAVTKDGKMTYCEASLENRGKGRCNHIAHQMLNESSLAFCKRVENLIKENKENNNNDRNENINKNNVGNKKNIPSPYGPKKILSYSMNSLLRNENRKEEVLKLERKLYKYSNFVALMPLEINKILRDKEIYGIKWYQEEYKKLDKKRMQLHNEAIGALCSLNRICLYEDLPLLYPGKPDEDYRGDVAESIFNFYSNINN